MSRALSKIAVTCGIGNCTTVERAIIKKIARAANQHWRRTPSANVNAIFLNAAAIQKLNRQYRHIDRSTTTLSFIYQGRGTRLDPWVGEMMFCRSIIKQRAKLANQTYPLYLAELTAHSLLHILGYDHQNNAQERKMDRLAARIIKLSR
jgi:rRNA maturation RNase YbeY